MRSYCYCIEGNFADFYAVAMLRNSIASPGMLRLIPRRRRRGDTPSAGEGLKFYFYPSPPKPPLNPAAGGNFSLIPPTGGLEGDFYAVALHSKPGDKAGPPTMLLRCIARD